jgi:methylglutamate dehydrogenase subunit D
MADCLAALPLGKTLAPGRYGADRPGPVTLRSAPADVCTLVAGSDPNAVIGKARAAFATDLRDAPRRSGGGDIQFVGTSPGRWLVLSTAAGLADRLEAAFAPDASVFEQGGGLVVLEAGGEAMRAVLAKLVPLDLHPAVFGDDAAATTTAAHINVTMWFQDSRWRFAVGRSYLAAFLRAFAFASAEYGLDWAG